MLFAPLMLVACGSPTAGNAGPLPTPSASAATIEVSSGVASHGPTLGEPLHATSTIPTTEPIRGPVTITNADQGRTVELTVGENVSFQLNDSFDWTFASTNEAVTAQTPDNLLVEGTQGVFRAMASGVAELTAIGEPRCRKSKPACGLPSIQYQITVIVR